MGRSDRLLRWLGVVEQRGHVLARGLQLPVTAVADLQGAEPGDRRGPGAECHDHRLQPPHEHEQPV